MFGANVPSPDVVHEPVSELPALGVFPANVAVPVSQIVWSTPASGVVSAAVVLVAPSATGSGVRAFYSTLA